MKKILMLLFIVTILISGCTNNAEIAKLKQENEQLKAQLNEYISEDEVITATSKSPENSSSEITASWIDTEPLIFENGFSMIELSDKITIKQLPKEGNKKEYICILYIKYTNNGEEGTDYINDFDVHITGYQNNIELSESLGSTSKKGIYDIGSSFTKVKNGASIECQKILVLQDIHNEIELNIGTSQNKIVKKIALSS